LRRIVRRLRGVRVVVERVLDRHALGPEVDRGDTQRVTVARAVRAMLGPLNLLAGPDRRARRVVPREHGAVAALAEERDVRLGDDELLAVAAAPNEDDERVRV